MSLRLSAVKIETFTGTTYHVSADEAEREKKIQSQRAEIEHRKSSAGTRGYQQWIPTSSPRQGWKEPAKYMVLQLV